MNEDLPEQPASNHESPKRSATIPRWLFIVLIIMGILLAAFAIISAQLKPFVASRLIKAVEKGSDGLYKAKFKDIHISLLNGNISFDSLSIIPDSAALVGLKKKGKYPARVFTVRTKGLSFKDIGLWEVYRHKNLRISSILLWRPEVTIRSSGEKKSAADSNKNAYEQISDFLKSLHVNQIILNEASINVLEGESRESSFKVEGLTLKARGLAIDSASQFNKDRFLYTEDIQFKLANHTIETNDGLYTIKIGLLASSTAARSLKVKRLRIIPNLPEMEFSRKFKVRTDRYDIKFSNIDVTGIDFPLISSSGKYRADKAIADGFQANIFMNREMPPVDFDKGKNYPHMALRRLKTPITIKRLLLKRGLIKYTEFEPKTQRKGTIGFHNFAAVVQNITNEAAYIKKDNWSKASIDTRFMNAAPLHVNLNFNLSSGNGDFNFNGVMSDLNMRALNTMSRNLSLAEIESGRVSKAEFSVAGNLKSTSGSLKLYYSDLKVKLLKKDEDSGTLEKKGLISALANTFVIKDRNPDADGSFRIGKTAAVRIPSGSFFNLMWRAVFEGLKESIGMKAAKSEVQVSTPETDSKESRKEKREARREERKRQRELKKSQ